MTSMIERVTEAIAKADQEGRNSYESYARAAIEAMREPSAALHEAASEISVYFDDFSCGDGNITLGIDGYPDKLNRVWSELIDAALKETTT
ncbi:hypothetical protein AAIH70_28315 [Neorhizobium sp. BT27B]|uniref:hypothetical protein n=1 Tax=Neorhizobium sp. BT27B TaxID=3142625 RepID=UPI003D2C27F5